jgi:hypothetical protein
MVMDAIRGEDEELSLKEQLVAFIKAQLNIIADQANPLDIETARVINQHIRTLAYIREEF